MSTNRFQKMLNEFLPLPDGTYAPVVYIETVDASEASSVLAKGDFKNFPQGFRLMNGRMVPVLAVIGGAAAPVTIDGLASPNNTLRASLTPGWQITGGQWTRDGVDISGATGATYAVLESDVGKTIGYNPTGVPFKAVGVLITNANYQPPVVEPVFTVQPPSTRSANEGGTVSIPWTLDNGSGTVAVTMQSAPASNPTNFTDIASNPANPYVSGALTVSADNGRVYRIKAQRSGGQPVYSNTVTTTVTAAASTKPRWFSGPANAATVGTQAFIENATQFGADGGKAGSFTDVNPTTSSWGWYAALASAGAPVFTDVGSGFTGGWDSRGNVTVNGQVWQLWQRNYPQSGGATTVA